MSRRVLPDNDVMSDSAMSLQTAPAQRGQSSALVYSGQLEKNLKNGGGDLTLPFIGKLLAPHIGHHVVARRRLLDLLHRGLQRRVTTICAPAGYGKTTLTASFLADAELPACWYGLDEADTDARSFVEYLLAAIRLSFPGFGQRTLAALRAEDRDIAFVIGSLVTELYNEVREPFLLVLDDIHVVAPGGPIATALDTFVRQAPEHCRILLLSRTPVELPCISRLTASREVSRLTAADLAFTDEEAAQLLEALSVQTTAEARDRLLQQCEGWAAGLVLATLDGSTNAAAPGDEDLFRYLASEVYQRQPAELQTFLRRSSVLYELTPDSCTGALRIKKAKATLRELSESLQFVSSLEGGQVYRYHSLFRGFLAEKLREDEREFSEVHRRAGQYFAGRGSWEAALFHFGQAGCPDEAAQVVQQAALQVYDAGRWRVLAGWIDDLPSEAVDHHPSLLVHRARVAVQMGQAALAMQYCARAHEIAATDARWLLPQVHVARAAAFRLQGLLDRCIEESEAAIALLAEPADRASRLTLGEALHYKGNGLWQSGALDEAIPALQAALEQYRELGDLYRISFAHHNLGSVFRHSGHYTKAMAHFTEAIRGWRLLGNQAQLAATLNNLGYLYRERDLNLAEQTLREAVSLARDAGAPLVVATALGSLGAALALQGKHADARETFEHALEAARAASVRPELISSMNGLGLVCLAEGDMDMSRVLIEQAAGLAGHEIGAELRAQVLVSQATVYLALDQPHRTLGLLEEAGGLLSSKGSRETRARLQFQLARLHWAQGDAALDSTLGNLAVLLAEPGSELPLLLEARLAGPLVRYAAALPRIAGPFRRLLDALDRFQPEVSAPRVLDNEQRALPAVRAYALGRDRVEIEDGETREVRWATKKSKEMFFYLVLHGPLHKEAIIEALWPEVSPAKGDTLLWSHAYRIRRSLYPESLVHNESVWGLNSQGSFWLDALEFQDLVRGAGHAGAAQDPSAAIPDVERAVDLYDGEFLPGLYSDWAGLMRDRLQERFLGALLLLARKYVERGAVDDAIKLCDRALQADSCLEEAYFVKIKALAGAGRRPEAGRTFTRYLRAVEADSGVPPEGKLVELRELIRTG